jgi:hypothetical protein
MLKIIFCGKFIGGGKNQICIELRFGQKSPCIYYCGGHVSMSSSVHQLHYSLPLLQTLESVL